MICAIMQPTYLPWVGYFDLMDQADVFVLLDNVQFSRQSWQQRNRIRTAKGLEWLTLPVRHNFGQTINEVEISGKPFADHLRRIRENYSRAPNFDHLFYYLESIYSAYASASIPMLADINQEIISACRQALGINTKIVRASQLSARGKRAELCAEICLELGADTYLAVPGSLEYLMAEVDEFDRRNISVVVQNYRHPVWVQRHEPFLPFASVIDLIFNEGEPGAVMRSGRNTPNKLEVRPRADYWFLTKVSP